MEDVRVNAKISRKYVLRVLVTDDALNVVKEMNDCSYENLQSLLEDARRKMPSDYDRKTFGVQVSCEAKNWAREYRVPMIKPNKRKR